MKDWKIKKIANGSATHPVADVKAVKGVRWEEVEK